MKKESAIGLTKDQINSIVRISLYDDPIFDASLFHMLTGIEVNRYRLKALDSNLDLSSSNEMELFSRIISNIINYPHGQFDRIFLETGVTKSQIKRVNDSLVSISQDTES